MDAAEMTAAQRLLRLRAANNELIRLTEALRLSVAEGRDIVYREEIEPLLRPHVERLSTHVADSLALPLLAPTADPPHSNAGLLELQERLRRVGAALDAGDAVGEQRRPLWRMLLAVACGVVAAFWWLGIAAAVGLLPVSPDPERKDASSGTLAFLLGMGVAFALFALALWRPFPRRLPSSGQLARLGAVSLGAAVVMAAALPGARATTAHVGEVVEVAGLASIVAPGDWPMTRNTEGFAPSVDFARDLPGDRSRPEGNETLRADLVVVPMSGVRLSHEEFFADLIAGAKGNTEGGRIRPLSVTSRVDTSRGTECLRYDKVSEDRGVPQFVGTVFLLTYHDIVCFHPSGSAVVRARWSHRYLASAAPSVPETDADPYLDSLRLMGTPPREEFRQRPGLHGVVFLSRFTAQDRWTRFDNEHVLADYGAGVYVVTQRKPWSFTVAVPNAAPKARDVHIEVDVRFARGDGGPSLVGPTCRLTPSDKATYYAFLISPTGFYGIARVANTSELHWLAAAVFWSRPAIGTELKHRIEADCVGADDGTVLSLRVDGTDLLQIRDTGKSLTDAGYSGLYVQGDKGFSATVTNFVVWNAVP